jgi:predicted MFS family arabinose efflux permease
MSGFMIVPNISGHLLMNLDYPREHLGILYFCGGSVSFFGMRFSGRLVDDHSSTLAYAFFTVTFLIAIGSGFVWFPSIIPIVVIFILFMFSTRGRMIAAQTLLSKIPLPHERGAFTALQTTTIHLFSSLGAYLSSLILVEQGGKLLHMPTLGMLAIATGFAGLALIWAVERSIKKAH